MGRPAFPFHYYLCVTSEPARQPFSTPINDAIALDQATEAIKRLPRGANTRNKRRPHPFVRVLPAVVRAPTDPVVAESAMRHFARTWASLATESLLREKMEAAANAAEREFDQAKLNHVA